MSFTIWTCGWWQLAKEGMEFSCQALDGNPLIFLKLGLLDLELPNLGALDCTFKCQLGSGALKSAQLLLDFLLLLKLQLFKLLLIGILVLVFLLHL